MELLPLVCLCLLSCSGDAVRVFVEEGSDAVLNCSFSTEEEDIRRKFFDWKKDGQKEKKEVFRYDAGIHYNNGRTGQDEQFRGRVSHFQDELQNGNASIKIHKTKMADSGNYRCIFPSLPRTLTFYITLVVDPVLKDRTGENIPGAASKPYLTTVRTNKAVMLQCEVLGASPKPKVEWKDSSGNVLQAEEPQVTESGGRYDIVLRAAVTKTDTFRCVVTQEGISHQISDEIHAVNGSNTGWIVAGVVSLLLVVVAVLAGLYIRNCIKKHHNKGSRPNTANGPTAAESSHPMLENQSEPV